MKKFISYLFFVFCFLLACNNFSNAQQPTAAFTGVVTDQNGVVISNATVTATNKATNLVRTVTINGDGNFVIPNLHIGNYEVSIESAGFKKTVIENNLLNVGQTLTRDVTLEVGGITTSGDTLEPDSLIDSVNSKVDAVTKEKEVENLPLNGRNFLELALLTPGNAPAPNFDQTKTNTVLISSAGRLGRGGSVTIDGTDNNDDVGGGSLVNISQDAVAEFQTATNRFSAEYGRSGSSVINVVSKSGTNEVRGSVSFFERDKRLQGLPATFNRTQTAPFDRQQYSFTRGARAFQFAG